MNKIANKQSLPMYRLIELLAEESEFVDYQIKLVSTGKLQRYQREAFRRKQSNIFSIWDKYNNNESFTSIDLLTAVSRVKDGLAAAVTE